MIFMNYDIDYLTLLAQQYPTVKSASTEIIRLQSRQKLPKLTEHFMSDIHGEYESFLHILKNASGVIKDKITSIYGRTLSKHAREILATLIYYPEQKLEIIIDHLLVCSNKLQRSGLDSFRSLGGIAHYKYRLTE